jgi:hypothetical protein
MVSAPPTPLFVGDPLPSRATINQHEQPVNGEGRIRDIATILNAENEYHIAGVSESSSPVQRRVRLEEPSLICREDEDILSKLFGNYSEPLPDEVPIALTQTTLHASSLEQSQNVILDQNIASGSSLSAIFDPRRIWWALGQVPGVVQRLEIKNEQITGTQAFGEEVVWAIGFGPSSVVISYFGASRSLFVSRSERRFAASAQRLWFDLLIRVAVLPCLEYRTLKYQNGLILNAPSTPRYSTASLWQDFIRHVRTQQLNILPSQIREYLHRDEEIEARSEW